MKSNTERKKKIASERFRLPKLNNRGGDLDKRWYVEYYLWNETEQQLERQQVFVPTAYKTAKERRAWAVSTITEVTDLMRQGYIYVTEKRKKTVKRLSVLDIYIISKLKIRLSILSEVFNRASSQATN